MNFITDTLDEIRKMRFRKVRYIKYGKTRGFFMSWLNILGNAMNFL